MTLAARTVWITLPAGLALAALGAVGCTKPVEVTVPAPKRSEGSAPADLKYAPVGMSGCLAAACHGAPARDLLAGKYDTTTWQSSGSCWVAADPHAAAYSLLTARPHRPVKVTAAHIMARYAPGTEAVNDARCVACHTNPTLAAEKHFNEPSARTLRTEGVSCEACHGSAGGWVTDHTTWSGDRKDVYAKTGLVPLYDLGERAVACAGCHVGAPADPDRGIPVRDMNHDMIAAGHPRLNFDFAEYLRRLPTHWQEKDRTQTPPAPFTLNPAKAWLVGRVAHAEAACRLLADRAARTASDPRTPWPEFAEFNCAACHHNLRAAGETDETANWRKEAEHLAGRALGAAPWQPIWPLTAAAGIDRPAADAAPLKDVVRAMSVPRPRRADAAQTALRVAGELAGRRQKLVAATAAEVEAEARGQFPKSPLRAPEWDSAAQLFFGSAALERARPSGAEIVPVFRKALAALRTDDWPRVKWVEVNEALEAIGNNR
jgi:hypothetical protein